MRRIFSMIVALVIALTALTSVPVARGAGEAVAPQVIDSAPAPGAELAPDGAVTFYFDQPMDQASVQAALKANPLTPGNLSWTNDSTVSFKPNSPLARGNQYTFTIGSGAKSKAGLPMRDTYSLRLRTAGALEVTQVFPANGAVNIEATPTINVIFSRPVVRLGTAEEMATLPSPLAIAPGVDGKGEWTSTSIYTFKPSTALAGGQKYTVIVCKGLTDLTSRTLPNHVPFSFSVAGPHALARKMLRQPT